MDPILKQSLDWYAHLAAQPGWKAYCWAEVQRLAREHPGIFWKLPDLLVERMQREAAHSLS
jgi:hypothetical protein